MLQGQDGHERRYPLKLLHERVFRGTNDLCSIYAMQFAIEAFGCGLVGHGQGDAITIASWSWKFQCLCYWAIVAAYVSDWAISSPRGLVIKICNCNRIHLAQLYRKFWTIIIGEIFIVGQAVIRCLNGIGAIKKLCWSVFVFSSVMIFHDPLFLGFAVKSMQSGCFGLTIGFQRRQCAEIQNISKGCPHARLS